MSAAKAWMHARELVKQEYPGSYLAASQLPNIEEEEKGLIERYDFGKSFKNENSFGRLLFRISLSVDGTARIVGVRETSNKYYEPCDDNNSSHIGGSWSDKGYF